MALDKSNWTPKMEAGAEKFYELFTEHYGQITFAAVQDLYPDFLKIMLEHGLHDMWGRGDNESFPYKYRAFCSMSMFLAIGATKQFKLLVTLAMNNGATEEEIYEVMMLCALELGIPTAWNGFIAAKEAIEEYKKGI